MRVRESYTLVIQVTGCMVSLYHTIFWHLINKVRTAFKVMYLYDEAQQYVLKAYTNIAVVYN